MNVCGNDPSFSSSILKCLPGLRLDERGLEIGIVELQRELGHRRCVHRSLVVERRRIGGGLRRRAAGRSGASGPRRRVVVAAASHGRQRKDRHQGEQMYFTHGRLASLVGSAYRGLRTPGLPGSNPDRASGRAGLPWTRRATVIGNRSCRGRGVRLIPPTAAPASGRAMPQVSMSGSAAPRPAAAWGPASRVSSGGGGGIRTHGGLPPSSFQDCHLRPLGHPSLALHHEEESPVRVPCSAGVQALRHEKLLSYVIEHIQPIVSIRPGPLDDIAL